MPDDKREVSQGRIVGHDSSGIACLAARTLSGASSQARRTLQIQAPGARSVFSPRRWQRSVRPDRAGRRGQWESSGPRISFSRLSS